MWAEALPAAGEVDAYLRAHDAKELLRLVVIGSVDDGKSTLIGRLLYDSGRVYDDQLAAAERQLEPLWPQLEGQPQRRALLVIALGVRARLWWARGSLDDAAPGLEFFKKLNDAGSGSNPWTEVIESGFTAAQILRLLAAHAAGAATGLESGNPQFIGLDGSTVRIDGTYSGGTRSIDALDGD